MTNAGDITYHGTRWAKAKQSCSSLPAEVINYWQDDESSHTVEDARKRFPDCTFAGA